MIRTLRSTQVLMIACLVALAVAGAWLGPVGHTDAADSGAAVNRASVMGFWPLMMLGATEVAPNGASTGLGAPERLQIPSAGKSWTSAASMDQAGFLVAWARLKPGTSGTITAAVSADGRKWNEIIRTSANANRSMPYLNLTLPVPQGYRFQLKFEGSQGQGAEIIEEQGGHWFPLGSAGAGS